MQKGLPSVEASFCMNRKQRIGYACLVIALACTDGLIASFFSFLRNNAGQIVKKLGILGSLQIFVPKPAAYMPISAAMRSKTALFAARAFRC